MEISVKQIHDLYQLNTSMLGHVLRGFSEQDALSRPLERANPVIWIVGHMTANRFMVAQILGVETKDPFNGAFGKSFDLN
ncbi:MAG: hypothetical protein PVF49_10885, partial [Anaerolineales bacterium]